MKNFARVMGLLFGSVGAHNYPKFGQVSPPPPKVICMSVKMAITTRKTASCVFQLIQVLDTANRKKHNVCSVYWRIFSTPGKYHECIRGYLELTSEARYHDSCRVYS